MNRKSHRFDSFPKTIASTMVACSLVYGVSASAETIADFYQGKQITMLVDAEPGPAYDLFARMLVAHMGAYIPGKPTFLVRNMPGAGGINAVNYAYNQGPRDGTLIFTMHINLPLEQALGSKGVRFDAAKLIGLGRLSAGNTVSGAWHTAGIATYKDLYKKEMVIGGGQATSNTAVFPTVAKNIFGLKLKVVSGYKSLSDQMLAMERGETQGLGSISLETLRDSKPDYLGKRLFVPLFQWGLKREAELPDVPTVGEIATDPLDKQAVEVLASQIDIGRSFYMPPGVPPDRVKVLRAAFDATVKDPGFLADAKKTRSEIVYGSGEEMERIIAGVLDVPKQAVERLQKAMDMHDK
jgi:tripartite-type tricarboxylate transporter receptor subunit TctC